MVRRPHQAAGEIELGPMRRRHLRAVLRIEALVYPRPWSATLFLQEMARRSDRYYIVAKTDGDLIGYGGMITGGPEAHITTLAVDPEFQRQKVGTKVLIDLLQTARDRGAGSVSLEVRKSNIGAQRLYEDYGFKPVGVRKGYYIETGEDAIVMVVEGIQSAEYDDLLSAARSRLGGR